MRTKIISLMIAVLSAGAFASCSDWTEPEARDFTQHKPASYYENLRAWKADKSHPIAFGWFGGWDPTGATTATSLMGIPDSVSLVANWATFSLTPEQMEEVVQVKKLKGTDVVVTILLTNVGAKATPEEVTAGVEDTWEQVRLMREYWGWTDDADAAQIEAAIRKYANGLVDEVLKYGYTGLDLDYEPGLGSYHNGNIVMNQSQQGDIYAGTSPSQRTTWFVDECSKRLGPKSGSGKLLIVDGLVSSMPKETIECFDYYILQTYTLTDQSSLDSYRLAGLVNAFGDIIDEETITNRTLVTENFEPEASWKNGGYSCRIADGTYTNSLQAMALWQPANGFRKGGIGAYQMQNDFKNDCYKYFRAAINAMDKMEKGGTEADDQQ